MPEAVQGEPHAGAANPAEQRGRSSAVGGGSWQRIGHFQRDPLKRISDVILLAAYIRHWLGCVWSGLSGGNARYPAGMSLRRAQGHAGQRPAPLATDDYFAQLVSG